MPNGKDKKVDISGLPAYRPSDEFPAYRPPAPAAPAASAAPALTAPKQDPGLLPTLGQDLWGMAKGLAALPGQVPGALETYRQIGLGGVAKGYRDYLREENAREKAAGYSPLYRTAATIGRTTGIIDPAAMEEAAAQGHTGEVLGHAAAPLAAMAMMKGVSKLPAAARTLSVIADKPGIQEAARTTLNAGREGMTQTLKNSAVSKFNELKEAAPKPALPVKPLQEAINKAAAGRQTEFAGRLPKLAQAIAEVDNAAPLKNLDFAQMQRLRSTLSNLSRGASDYEAGIINAAHDAATDLMQEHAESLGKGDLFGKANNEYRLYKNLNELHNPADATAFWKAVSDPRSELADLIGKTDAGPEIKAAAERMKPVSQIFEKGPGGRFSSLRQHPIMGLLGGSAGGALAGATGLSPYIGVVGGAMTGAEIADRYAAARALGLIGKGAGRGELEGLVASRRGGPPPAPPAPAAPPAPPAGPLGLLPGIREGMERVINETPAEREAANRAASESRRQAYKSTPAGPLGSIPRKEASAEPAIEIINEPSVTPSGHTGGTTASLEEGARTGTNYVVSKSGDLTHHGKAYAPESIKPGEAYISVQPDGTIKVEQGELTPSMRAKVERNVARPKSRSAVRKPPL